MRRALLGLCLALLATACGSTQSSGPASDVAPATIESLFGTEWTLTSMDFRSGFLVMSSARQHPTLVLAEPDPDSLSLVSGFAGVNQFAGDCRVAGDGSLSFGDLTSTRMAGDSERMKLERAYFAHLAGAESFELNATGLVISTSSGTLMFRAPIVEP